MRRGAKVRRVTCPTCAAAPGDSCQESGAPRAANHAARVKAHKVAFPAAPRVLAPAGVLAWWEGPCPRCPNLIQRHVSQVVERKGSWIHTSCAPGADDA